LTLRLPYRAPYDFRAARVLRAARFGVETVDENSYRGASRSAAKPAACA
jgi:hypothetical protein